MDPVVIWARAALLTAVTMFLGVAAHVTADGLLPSAAWLVVLSLLVLVPCVALLAGPASPLRLVLMLAGGQALVHLALTITAGHAAQAGTGHVHAAGSHRHLGSAGSALETLQTGSGTTTGALSADGLAQHLAGHAPMMLVHVLAAALVGLWLAVGERALWTLVALAGGLVVRPLLLMDALARPALAAPAPPTAPGQREPRRPSTSLLLARCVVRRGPPLLAI